MRLSSAPRPFFHLTDRTEAAPSLVCLLAMLWLAYGLVTLFTLA